MMQSKELHDSFGRGDIVLLDGGFGTTLEDVFQKNISDTPLWSAALIDKEPETVVAAHLAFLEAGSRIILTCNYQCSFEGFNAAGYSKDTARALMLEAVKLADEARTQFAQKNSGETAGDVRVALSLGPYAATLSPMQEFDGFYPPPYGPKGFTSEGDNWTAFDAGDTQKEAEAEDALVQFHLERLRVFKEDSQTWRMIDCIAFETVPLAREIKAIRKAMGRLTEDFAATKPWWISTVWPNGKYPEERTRGGERLTAADIAKAIFADEKPSYPAPHGIGINCTRSEYLSTVAHQFGQTLNSLTQSKMRPWLFMYPNGSEYYDSATQAWVKPTENEGGEGSWAESLVSIVQEEREKGVWGGIAVGGCCKTGPQDIRALSQNIYVLN